MRFRPLVRRKTGTSQAGETEPQSTTAPSLLALVIPNMVTVASMACGLTAMRHAMEGRFKSAVILIFLAALFDGLDGRLARRLNASSRFGAAMDNLADFLSFGIAPAFIMYLWALEVLGAVGWYLSLAYVICCMLRLARFLVTAEDENRPAWQATYFTGLPSPAGAAVALLPLTTSLAWDTDMTASASLNGIWILGAALLMVSTFPTFSVKALRPPRKILYMASIFAAFLLIAFLIEPFKTLVVLVGLYLATLPISALRFLHLRKRWRQD